MSFAISDISKFGPAAQKQIMEQMNGKAKQDKPSKMHNTPTEYKGQKFQSIKEARRFGYLLLLLEKGVISDLRLQHNITITEGYTKPDGQRVRPQVYKADFSYIKDGKRVYEDTKGYRTRVFINKKKAVMDIHGIDIKEV